MAAARSLRYKCLDGEQLMEVNDKAPDFTLPDQEENPVALKEFRGKTVVLFFFPKADTPG
jgi:peroxiredoxin Q/BCP